MSHHKRHLLEKVQVQIAAVAALAAVYFLIAPALGPRWPGGATVFVPAGDYGRFAFFAAVVWVIAAGCAALTLSARREGALLATLVGVAGFSFTSGPMRMLLWQWNDNFGRLFALLSAEVLGLAAVVLGAMIVIALVRAGLHRLLPKLTWKYPSSGANPADNNQTGKTRVMYAAGAVIMELAVAMLLLVITFRSTERGQIAFALAASFFVAALVAHQTFPIRTVVPLWCGPILMAVLVFGLGWVGASVGPDGGPSWQSALMAARNLPLRAALPVDWLTLGTGGAVAGFWLSSRMHETKPADNKSPARK